MVGPQPLALAILTIEPASYSSQRLVLAAEARGHRVHVFDTTACVPLMNAEAPSLLYKGESLPPIDVVIPRIGAAMTGHGCAVVRQFQSMGAATLADADAMAASRDKRCAHQRLSGAGLPMPTTSFVCVPQSSSDMFETMGPLPLILKPVQSSQGQGIVLVKTAYELERAVAELKDQETDFLVQEFVAEAQCEDIRCFVIGDDVVAAMKRHAAPGEFRSNLHQGGTAERVEISHDERALAVKATQTLGLSVAGVDLLRGRHGPLVLEVNLSPGLHGIETCTGRDVATPMIAEAERLTARGAASATKTGAAA